MPTFAEKIQEFDRTLGSVSVLSKSLLSVNGEYRECIPIKNERGARLEEYYKWQFIYAFVESGLCENDFIGVEISFPKGSPSSRPITLDAAIFDSKEWNQYYDRSRSRSVEAQSALIWLRRHLIVAIEFKRESGRGIQKYVSQQLAPAMQISEVEFAGGLYYDTGRIWVFRKQPDNKILRYHDSKNRKGCEDYIGALSLEIPDDYSSIPSFDEIIDRVHYERSIRPIVQQTENVIAQLRSLSVDRLIKERNEGILDTPLLAFRSREAKEGFHEPYSESLENALHSEDPVIIFGHGGQGKTILATETARKLLGREFGEKHEKSVPVILNCAEISSAANKNIDSYGEPRIDALILEQALAHDLPKASLRRYKLAFIIDDYQKLSPDHATEMEQVLQKLRKQGNLVILFSRLERTDVYPPNNEGYETMQIDTETIAEQTAAFMEGRVPSEHREGFRQYLRQYDASITGYYMNKLFLTMVFPGGTQSGGVVRYVVDPSIAKAIAEGSPLSRIQLYEAVTDYITGCDVHRENPTRTIEQVRKEIVSRKNQLAEKAFRDIFAELSRPGDYQCNRHQSPVLDHPFFAPGKVGHGISSMTPTRTSLLLVR